MKKSSLKFLASLLFLSVFSTNIYATETLQPTSEPTNEVVVPSETDGTQTPQETIVPTVVPTVTPELEIDGEDNKPSEEVPVETVTPSIEAEEEILEQPVVSDPNTQEDTNDKADIQDSVETNENQEALLTNNETYSIDYQDNYFSLSYVNDEIIIGCSSNTNCDALRNNTQGISYNGFEEDAMHPIFGGG